jgi:very-short-patch-repair endonuclease
MADDQMSPVEFARYLRRCQQPGEELLWHLLRNRRLVHAKFRRQHPVPPYNCDFFCFELSLDIECDGKDHFTEEGKRKDANRTKFLNDLGITVLRFTNFQIENETQQVLQTIQHEIERLRAKLNSSACQPSPPAPLPEGEGGNKNT